MKTTLTSVALILVAAISTAAETDIMTQCVEQFKREAINAKVNYHIVHNKWMNMDVVKENFDEALKGMDDLTCLGQIYPKKYDWKVIYKACKLYSKSENDSERVHWFMVLSAITERDSELVDILINDRKYKKLLDIIVKADTIDASSYVADEVKAGQLLEAVLNERQKIRQSK